MVINKVYFIFMSLLMLTLIYRKINIFNIFMVRFARWVLHFIFLTCVPVTIISICDMVLPFGNSDYTVYYDASKVSLSCVIMQHSRIIAYAYRKLKNHKRNYLTHDLELT